MGDECLPEDAEKQHCTQFDFEQWISISRYFHGSSRCKKKGNKKGSKKFKRKNRREEEVGQIRGSDGNM